MKKNEKCEKNINFKAYRAKVKAERHFPPRSPMHALRRLGSPQLGNLMSPEVTKLNL